MVASTEPELGPVRLCRPSISRARFWVNRPLCVAALCQALMPLLLLAVLAARGCLISSII